MPLCKVLNKPKVHNIVNHKVVNLGNYDRVCGYFTIIFRFPCM